MRINNNISAMNTYSRLTSAQGAQAKSLEKLSSGLRINRAGDDAAGLAISEKMRGQIKGLNQSVRNAQDGISLIQTAEGALNETHSILNRMRELAVQSANDTNTDADRVEIQKEVDQLATEMTRISTDTQFNTQDLLTGTFNGKFHIGANASQNMTLEIEDMGSNALKVEGNVYKKELVTDLSITTRNESLKVIINEGASNGDALNHAPSDNGNTITINLAKAGDGSIDSTLADIKSVLEGYGIEAEYAIGENGTSDAIATAAAGVTITVATDRDDDLSAKSGLNVSSQVAADTAITTIDNAIKTVSAERSKLGAVQNRLDHTINNLTATSENLSAAESRIRDVDMAKEMMEFTKNNILNQASTAMLAQANQMPQGVLQLLG